jgi:hypothetical protein
MQSEQIQYNIRTGQLSDMNLFLDTYFSSIGISYNKEEVEKIFEQRIKDDKYRFFVLLTGKEAAIAGCAIVKVEMDLFNKYTTTEIKHLYIYPKFRKLNAADSLYAYVEEKAKVGNSYLIKVACGINSTLNQRFYSRKKFVFTNKLFLKYIN